MHDLLDRLRSVLRSRRTGRTGTGSSGGLVVPSPVVMLTIVAVALAAVAFVVTRNPAPTERQIATASQPEVRPTHTAAPAHPEAPPHTTKPQPPAVDRGKVYVEVFNNSGISGLAGSVGSKAGTAGWKVVGTDNWYGSIPTNTVYFPPRLAAAGKQLALDLGVRRTAPAVAPMQFDRLTVILTAPLP